MAPIYSDLYDQRFLDAFPPRRLILDEHRTAMLEELGKIIHELCYDNLVYTSYADAEDERKIECDGFIHDRLLRAQKRWDHPLRFGRLARSSRDKGDPRFMTRDEVLFRLIYPFWNRVGGSFEVDFAEVGHLGEYLRLLKEKDQFD